MARACSFRRKFRPSGIANGCEVDVSNLRRDSYHQDQELHVSVSEGRIHLTHQVGSYHLLGPLLTLFTDYTLNSS